MLSFPSVLSSSSQIPVRDEFMYSRGDHDREHEAASKEKRIHFLRRVFLHLAQFADDTMCVRIGRAAEKP
jgi:hypothetical protein